MSIRQVEAPTVVIEVRGGAVQRIVGNQVMDAIIIDWDNIKSDDTTTAVHETVFIDRGFVSDADSATINRHNLKFLEGK